MSKKRYPKYWLALRFPLLPMEVFADTRDCPEPIIVVHKQIVVCANPQAQAQGIHPGMPAATASLLADCRVLERDYLQEQQAVQLLADSVYNYTPYIEKQLPGATTDSGLTLEVSRSLKLFNGANRILQLIQQALEAFPYYLQCGFAHTAKAAWLLSYTQQASEAIPNTLDRKDLLTQLGTLPIQQLLTIPEKNIKTKALQKYIHALEQSGFDSLADLIRQIEKQSIASLHKRWGGEFTHFISDIFDIENTIQQSRLFEEPNEIYHPEENFCESIQFDYPISNLEQLHRPIEFLLQKLSDYLVSRQRQCQHIEWLLLDIHHNQQSLSVHSSQAQSQWQLLYELTLIQLETQSLSFEVDTLELSCSNSSAAEQHSGALSFSGKRSEEIQQHRDFAIVAAKLKARLGKEALFKIAYHDSHIPEQSNQKTPIDGHETNALASTHQQALRPNWLFNSPEAIQEKQQCLFWHGKLELLQGPERIEGQWWDKPTARDYFMAQREDHVRLWVFYDLLRKRWYVQGVFA